MGQATPIVTAAPVAWPGAAAPLAEMQEADGPEAQMFLDVGNPAAGDNIHVGKYMIEGLAFDGAADEGAGIERIDIFFDDRDTGGVLIGSAELGVPNPVTDDPQLSDAGWRAQVTIPRSMLGPRTLFVYALSSVTGGELVAAIPVVVVR
jgi:hypothetical protein